LCIEEREIERVAESESEREREGERLDNDVEVKKLRSP
jgi:hypothetical protein